MKRRPAPVTLKPASSNRRWSCQPRIFGPRIATLGWSSAALSNASRHEAFGALSSCKSQTQVTSSPCSEDAATCMSPTWASPDCTADPNPASRSTTITRSEPRDRRSRFGLSSPEPVSTPTTASACRVWLDKVVSTAGSHVAPSWETKTVVTW
ncbi:unannotated protein [freshwater metagenome]|uniref:Unannotated protein n=1 Tax=freshwater metagenome TaxID=449393 RepID=A0A6J7H2G3_9ZZZZ